jgi:hypothetical protein
MPTTANVVFMTNSAGQTLQAPPTHQNARSGLSEMNVTLSLFDSQYFFVIFFGVAGASTFRAHFFSNAISAARPAAPMENSEVMGITGLWE